MFDRIRLQHLIIQGARGAVCKEVARITLAMMVLAGTGCRVSSELPGMESSRGIATTNEPIKAAPPTGATVAHLAGDADRLAVDVGRAIDQSHWGQLRVERYRPPTHATVADSADAPRVVVRARALLPDERSARIVAWVERDGRVTAAIRVGLLGDPPTERAYLQTLRKVLKGDPAPVRRNKFHLPPGWPGLKAQNAPQTPSSHRVEPTPIQ